MKILELPQRSVAKDSSPLLGNPTASPDSEALASKILEHYE
jgi:hypothetical protein